jgi:Acetyltransferase (GNAT) family
LPRPNDSGRINRLPAADEKIRLALRDLQLFANYDSLRLRTYQDREHHSDRLRQTLIGSATALRFDDVGYFNRVYAPDQSISERLPEIEAFYEGCPFGCELIGPPIGASEQIDQACQSRGWVPGKSYAWVYSRISSSLVLADVSPKFIVRAPEVGEKTRFFLCYLQAFEAEPDRFDAALKNMRHLFDRPELSFLMAWEKNEPAGVAMLYREGKDAVLCAGATLAKRRRQGCHRAMLAARIQLAIQQGCQEIFSWALVGSPSQVSMQRAGIDTVAVTSAWHLRPGLKSVRRVRS